MSGIREELVRIYASNKVADVSNSPEYQLLCERYKDSRPFHGERDQVETVKVWVESRLDNAPTFRDQVRRALVQLNKRRRHSEQALLYELIKLGYEAGWSESQKLYFGQAWRVIQAKHDFFFSFTTRHYPLHAHNLVNSRYEHFIRSVVGSDRFRTADRSSENLLAEALYHLVAQAPRHGFMFTLHQNDNTQTEAKLREACAESIVFVQMVQNVMFEEPPAEKTNYCCFEYNEARRTIANERFIFVVAENSRDDLVPDFNVPPSYEAWHADVLTRDVPYLEETGAVRAAWIRSLKNKIEQRVIRKLHSIMQGIFEGVPE